MEKVILDTNVLVAGLYSSYGASHQILQLIEQEKIKPIISTTLLFEYEDVLKRNDNILNLSNQQVDIILDNLCALSDFQTIYFLWRPYLKDPKDDHVLEVAVASEISIILTHNIKDFKNIDKFDIQAMTPKAYLEAIK
ncbi:putative toxin-antitoxin system toxin component, PIN family [Candidatus Albibeggiatoa sp. nov. NOAA]|uniref:putative toxin-antitoxin system toxin component, PIN family n=1 Tax=Candidatus Albibeggiatoa sp. nov. NOAA TaxID=3162724 RepID=UPI0032F767A3|nr:putative toxin-antitoxin system toxin component, PIN family [Thiotrichaceae bacterium]